MSDLHENQPDDDFDSLYRRAFSADVGRPSESVRRAVLRHAAELAANRAADLTATGRHADLGTKRAGADPRWRRSAVYGSLAAAALACLVVVPHWLLPPTAVRAPAATVAKLAPSVAMAPAMSGSGPAPRTQDRQPGDVSAETSIDRQVDAIASYYDRPHAPRLPPRPARSSEGGASLAQESASRAMTATPAITAPAVSPPATASATASAAPAAAPRDAASALREAAETGNVPRLRALLDEHPDVDARDSVARTALMLAVINGRPGAVAALRRAGAR